MTKPLVAIGDGSVLFIGGPFDMKCTNFSVSCHWLRISSPYHGKSSHLDVRVQCPDTWVVCSSSVKNILQNSRNTLNLRDDAA